MHRSNGVVLINDYMKVGETTYDPINTDGNSVFELPVTVMDKPMDVIADTTAMSVPS